ncbi:MAG TPA: hypothetical protein DCS93_13875 [Microscillaceae bacterium]|nr:hypothetical protein [Microscillaceae bacterium]
MLVLVGYISKSYGQQSVTSLTLINASDGVNNGQPLLTLSNNQVVNLANLSTTEINIRANTNPATVGSVRFDLNGSQHRIEGVAPYALNGDNGGTYYTWTPSLGTPITIKATPFSEGGAGGVEGTSLQITVTFINQAQVTLPVAPSNLVATLNNNQIGLTWNDNSNNEDNFIIETTTDGGTTWATAATLGANSVTWTDTSPGNGLIRRYRIKANNTTGESATVESNDVIIPVPPIAPLAPSNLVATLNSGQVNLTWNDNSNDEDSFIIETTIAGGTTWAIVATLGVNSVTWIDTNPGNGLTRRYRIKASNIAGESLIIESNDVVIPTPPTVPAVPSNLVATLNNNQVGLTWNDNSNDEDNFIIETTTDGGTTWTVVAATLGANVTSWIDINPGVGVTRRYRIKASNTAGESATVESNNVIIPAPVGDAVTSLVLIDSRTNTPLFSLSNTNTINLADYPANAAFNIEAKTNPNTVGSIRFYVNGQLDATENVAPYAFKGDNGGNFNNWSPSLGTFTLEAIPYTGADGSGVAGTSLTVSITFVNQTSTIPPVAPTNALANLNTNQVNVSWDDNSNNETNFVIETTIDGGTTWAIAATLGANTTSWTDVDPGNQVTRAYRVKATNGVGESSYATSNALTISIPPVAPSNLTAITIQDGIRLTWNNNDASARTFRIEKKDSTETQFSTLRTILTMNVVPMLVLDDKSVGANQDRIYRVITINEVGDSAPSNEAQASANSGVVTGTLQKWHKITVAFQGPSTSETASTNPFTNYRLNVTFTNGAKTYVVPGYYAADGNAANTSATSGNVWLVHFAPDEIGTWTYVASFRFGQDIAISNDANAGMPIGFDGASGTFTIAASLKTGRDFRSKGRLQYVGQHYLQFSDSKEYFIKAGADAPENTFAYEDFDATPNFGNFRKSWQYHQQDYDAADASAYTWQNGKGTELLGAVKYLADQGMNVFSFLTFNLEGDDKNVFPHLGKVPNPSEWNDNDVYKTRFDVSKLAQWEKIMAYADKKGMYLHFKTLEDENDDLMNDTERRLYYRELIARFGHHLALNWNLGEENRSVDEAINIAMMDYIHNVDPYNHHIVIHNWVNLENTLYTPFLGNNSKLTGASLQIVFSNADGNNLNNNINNRVKEWRDKSAQAGKKWVVANDEQGNYQLGVGLDASYDPINGQAPDPVAQNLMDVDNRADVRNKVLWGALLAGAAGVEYYYGYQTGYGDLYCQDHRTRATKWQDAKHALDFFNAHLLKTDPNPTIAGVAGAVPYLLSMQGDNSLTNNSNDYVFAKAGEVYVIYLPNGGTTDLNLSGNSGTFQVQWYDPRNGGALQNGLSIAGGASVNIGSPPNETTKDWVALITRNDLTFRTTQSTKISSTISSYPNPADDQLFINLPSADSKGRTQIQLMSLQGRVVTQRQTSASQVILNIQHLKPGVYMLKIIRNGVVQIEKVIKR